MAPARVQSPGLRRVPGCQPVELRPGSRMRSRGNHRGGSRGWHHDVSGAGHPVSRQPAGRRRASGRAGAAYGRQMALEKGAERGRNSSENSGAPKKDSVFFGGDLFPRPAARAISASCRQAAAPPSRRAAQPRRQPLRPPPRPSVSHLLRPEYPRSPVPAAFRLSPAAPAPTCCLPAGTPGYLLLASGLPGGAAWQSLSREAVGGGGTR